MIMAIFNSQVAELFARTGLQDHKHKTVVYIVIGLDNKTAA